MNNKSITPNPQQPVDRVTTGQLPSALAELSEAEISAEGVLPATECRRTWNIPYSGYCSYSQAGAFCSYDGDDE